MKILLDIGHGGSRKSTTGKIIRDFGAVNQNYKTDEFHWNENFVKNYLIREFEKNGLEYKIILRKTGTEELISDLNKAAEKDDIILSFHLNSDVKASGTEVLYWETSMKGKKLAALIQKNLTDVLKLPDRGIKGRRKPLNSKDALNQRGWNMFRNTKVPFVMLESFFITNNKDLETGNKNITEMAKAVTNAVLKFMEVGK
jgi:N-acetylmuramoyl-L-alanine amidase